MTFCMHEAHLCPSPCRKSIEYRIRARLGFVSVDTVECQRKPAMQICKRGTLGERLSIHKLEAMEPDRRQTGRGRGFLESRSCSRGGVAHIAMAGCVLTVVRWH
jgi:hypothetical protein